MCVYFIQKKVIIIHKQTVAANKFQCSVCISVKRINVFTTLSFVFLSFTLSLPLSFIPLCSARFSSIQLNGSRWHEIWHVSPRHAPTEIDQSLNKSRCQPSFHLVLFTLAPFCVLRILSFHFLFVVGYFDSAAKDSPSTPASLFSPLFFHHPSLCVSWLTVMILTELRKMKVEWQNLLTFLLSSLAVLPKGEDSKWVMGQFLVLLYYKSSPVFLMSLGQRTASAQIDLSTDFKMSWQSI